VGSSRKPRRSRKSCCTFRWPNGTGWARMGLTASAKCASRMWIASGRSCSCRSSGIRTTAASRSSTSTAVRARAASVSSSRRLCAKERDTS